MAQTQPPNTHTGSNTGIAVDRESSIDVARGAAMLLVFLAHFSQELTVGPATSGVPLLLFEMGEIAPAAFVLVSGLTLAIVIGHTSPASLARARVRVLDRALFTLLVIHGVLVVTDVLWAPYERGLRQVFITDTLALSIMVGLVLVPRTGPTGRLAVGAILYGLGWIMHAGLHPAGLGFVAVAEEVLSGPTARHALDYGFPILEWAGVFLAGTVLGEAFVRARTSEARSHWAMRLLRGGAAAILGAVCVKALLVIPALHEGVARRADLREVLSLFGKAPPTPLYLMFFGGIAACIIAAATLLSIHGLAPGVSAWVAVLGRNSLFVFVLQSAVFRDLVARVPLEGRPWAWPVALGTATLFIWAGAWVWDRLGGNRWLTIGISQFKTAGLVEARHP